MLARTLKPLACARGCQGTVIKIRMVGLPEVPTQPVEVTPDG